MIINCRLNTFFGGRLLSKLVGGAKLMVFQNSFCRAILLKRLLFQIFS